jgi:hypothetical protein
MPGSNSTACVSLAIFLTVVAVSAAWGNSGPNEKRAHLIDLLKSV